MTSNKEFGRWCEVFGDDTAPPRSSTAGVDGEALVLDAAARLQSLGLPLRVVHHADVIALKGDSHPLKDRNLGRIPTLTGNQP